MSIRTYFENIATAIKEKNPNVTTVTPAEMPDAIRGISTGMPTIPESEWNSLTTEQKHNLGVIGIITAISGYERGIIVNGADYVDDLTLVSVYGIGQGTYIFHSSTLTLEFTNVSDFGGAILQINKSSNVNITMNLSNNTRTVQYGTCTKTATLPTIISTGSGRKSFYTGATAFLTNVNPTDTNLFMGIYSPGGSYKMEITIS